MLKLFKNHIDHNLTFLKESKILIAISGGIDSVVLAYLCHKTGLNVALAHCNFNLRNKESDGDEAFVNQLANQLDLEIFVEHFDTKQYAEDFKCSIQMAARELRYNWFNELAEQLKFDYVLTAHHADDNLETFLINFTRGTGLEGLIGIPKINGKLVRPLLPFSTDEIKIFALKHAITWREDSSNASVKYLRNKLRHEVIPILKAINPSLLASFQSTLNHLNDTADIVEQSTNAVLNRAVVTMNQDDIVFKISEFKKVNNPKAYLYEIFKIYGFTEWNDVVSLLDAQSGKQVFSDNYRLIKNREHLILSEIKNNNTETILISEEENKIETPFGVLFFDDVENVLETSCNTIYLDKDTIQFPLTLRKKQEGDFFYPLGMQGKKKLSKYFKDEKLSLIDKENIWLLCSGDNVLWVVNKRADNRFRVTEKSKNILKIKLDSHSLLKSNS